MKRRIVIADINSRCSGGVLSGHVIAVAENYCQLFRNETEVVVAGGPAYAQRFPNVIELDYNTEATLPVWENKRRNLHNIKQLFELCPNDVIVFQSSAVVTVFLGIALYKPPTCRVFTIQYNTEGVSSGLKRAFYAFARSGIDGVICTSERVGKVFGRPYCVVPDYIYSGAQNGEQLSYAEKKYDFCMVGLIYPDKGTVEAARLLAGSSYRVLIAGNAATPAIAEELSLIAAQSPNIELRLGYLPEEEYHRCLSQSRYGILNYRGCYAMSTSGVVYDALFSGLPVVGRRCPALAFIESSLTGVLADELSLSIFESVLNEDKYELFRSRIKAYYLTHQAHRESLYRFLTR